MHLRIMDYVFWCANTVMQVGVLAAMYRRGLHREYPYFFNYVLLQVISEPTLFFVQRHSYAMYYWGYWSSIALSALVSFAVLQEIFHDAFRPYEALRDLSVILFRWSVLVVLLIGVMWAITTAQSSRLDTFTSGVVLVQRSVRLMQCGLVFFLLLFSEYLGISRRHVLFGISLGFGIFASVSMLVAVAVAHGTFVHVSVLRQINSAAYTVSVLIWLGYTALAPSRSSVALAAARSKDWNYALEDARVQPQEDSLLDTMDRTVERLLYPREEAKASVVSANRSSDDSLRRVQAAATPM
ncbi:MAG: hypothetical protein WCC92_22660 [Candidatus Korobacteraceae bacterium]